MRKFLRKLFREVLTESLDEVVDELVGSREVLVDDLRIPVDIFDIPVSLNIDGKKSLEEKSKDYKRRGGAIAEDDVFVAEVCEYLGEQMRELSLSPENNDALMIRGKMFGVTELVNRLRLLGSEAVKKETNEDGLDEYFEDRSL